MLLAQGNVAAATAGQHSGPEPGPRAGYALEQKYLVLVRGLVAQRFPAAPVRLERLLAAESQDRTAASSKYARCRR
jgi:hypothetical protein